MERINRTATKLNLKTIALCIVFAATLFLNVFIGGKVSAFSGSGAGTAGDPYQITTCTQLQEMRDELAAHYRLENNIDCSDTANWNAGAGFEPVGDGTNWPTGTFTGTLDGQNHVITGLFINRSGYGVGLFGNLLAPAEISNVGLTGVDITGDDGLVGSLVGSIGSGATVENSYAEGSVTGGEAVGGLVGQVAGAIQNSYADATVTADSWAGGGLVGLISGTIQDSYATGSVSGNDAIGGFAGANEAGQISRSYSVGEVTGDFDAGGFIGYDDGGTVEDSFWNTETSGQATSVGGEGRTTAEMKDIATFSVATWDIEITNDHNLNDGYPFLSWQTGDSSPVWYIFEPSDSDGNGLPDCTEDFVDCFVNPVTGTNVVLEVDEACTINAASVAAESSNAVADSGFDYPAGLMNFTLDCGTPGYTTTIKQYYLNTTNDGYVLRKHDPNTNAYFAIAGATIEQTTLDGQTVTIATYQITDGGDLDIDGAANGTIVDPVGLAQGVVGAPNTGLGGRR